MAKNLEELRKENPQLAEQLMAEARAAASAPASAATPAATTPAGTTTTPATQPATPAAPTQPATPSTPDPVAAERQRLQDIDKMASLFDAETVNAAKYGETACTAQEMVYRAAQKAAQNGTAFMAAAKEDYQKSGAAGVGAAVQEGDDPSGEKAPGQRMAEARADVKALFGKKKEEK